VGKRNHRFRLVRLFSSLLFSSLLFSSLLFSSLLFSSLLFSKNWKKMQSALEELAMNCGGGTPDN